MKIVFIKDIPKIGKKNDIKDVADGYARFLLGNGSAVMATNESLSKVAQEKALKDSLKQKTASEFKAVAEKLTGKRFTLKAKVNNGKNLFGGIHEDDIKNIIHTETGVLLNPKSIKISNPIKQLGIHHIAVTEGTMHIAIEVEVLAD